MNDERLDVCSIHTESPGSAEAWGLDSDQQCMDRKTGRYLQFISSLSCDPITLYKAADSTTIKTDTSLLASQTEDQEMVYIEDGKSKTSGLLWVGICLALLTLTLGIIALIRVKGV